MNANRWIQVVCALICAACVLAAAALTPRIEKERKELQLTFTIEDGRDMPPVEAVTMMALGSFRGLAADVAWYRANQLQQAGKYNEANTWAHWITTLQPRFGQVWVFQGWNMAYNISVMTQTPEERWDWVQKGIRLVREKGIPYNESNVLLYKELAWWYFHKIGKYSDDMHWYYKRRFAEEWQIVLGNVAEGGTTEQILTAMETVVNAPDTVEALAAEDAAVRALLAKLKEFGWRQSGAGWFYRDEGGPAPSLERDQLLHHLGTILMFKGHTRLDSVTRRIVDHRYQIEGIDSRLEALLADEAVRPALDRLLATLRKRELIHYYRMKPDFMLEVMQGRAGSEDDAVPLPLDWRHPASHAIYWSLLGTRKAVYLLNKKNVDELNTYRQYIHAVQEMMYSGNITYSPLAGDFVNGRFVFREAGNIDMSIDVRYFDAYDQAYDAGVEYVLENDQFGGATADSFDTGHENFLVKAVVFSYLYGYKEKAAYYYDKVRRLYGDKVDNVSSGRYLNTLDDFVRLESPQTIEEYVGKVQIVDAYLHLGIVHGLAKGNRQVYMTYRELARYAFDKLNQTGNTIATADIDRMALGAGGFIDKEVATFQKFMIDRRFSDTQRQQVWAAAPDDLKRRVYDALRPQFAAMLEGTGIPVNAVLTEPDGMAEYRARVGSQLPENPLGEPSPQGPRIDRK